MDTLLAEPVLQRAAGVLRIALKMAGGETVLNGLRQEGCLRARFPRRLVPGWADIVTLNTSGGIAGGDRLDIHIDLAPETRATIAAQAAERFYRRVKVDGPSTVRTTMTVAPGATLEWLPQETILFDGCALDRRLDIDLAAGARFLGLEMLVFGRAAMGETVRDAWLRDRIRVRRDGTLLLHDAIRLDGAVANKLQQTAIAKGGRAVGTLVFVAPDAEQRLDAVRAGLEPLGEDVEAGASAWNGMLVTRIVASDSAALRRTVITALGALRDGRPLPRVWMC